LNLQRAVQSTIDLAAHLVSEEGLGFPQDLRSNFILMEQAKLISRTLSRKMQNMVGFRNIAVHDYSRINTKVLKSILDKNLGDLESFYKRVITFYHLDT
jgi:uncharacterized protein YutE (UPF0331/DUF86 family)